MKSKIPAAAGRADDGKTTGHGLGGRVGPTGAPLGADEQIGPGKEPGHPVLGKVEVKFVGNGSPDERPGITPVFADQAVEKNKAEVGVRPVKRLDCPDHLMHAFSLFVDSPIAEDLDFPARMSMAGNGLGRRLRIRERRKRIKLRQRIEYLRVYSAWSPVTSHLVFSFHPPADAFGTAKVIKAAARGLSLLLVALEDKIEEFCPSLEALEVRQDRIFAAETDLEVLGRDRFKWPDLPPELQPTRRLSSRSEQDKAMAPSDERVPNLDGAADSAKYFHMREQRGNFHLGMNVARAAQPVKVLPGPLSSRRPTGSRHPQGY